MRDKMGVGVGILGFIQKLGTVVTNPFTVLEDWAREPLKRWEHDRNEESRQQAHQREMDKMLAEEKIRSDLRIKEEKANPDNSSGGVKWLADAA